MAPLFFLVLLLAQLSSKVLATDCSADSECPASSGGNQQSCCSWDNTVGNYTSGKCGEMCTQSFVALTNCTNSSDCNSQTCCSWNSQMGINTKGVCGDVCAMGAFQAPTNCTSGDDCTASEMCCNWDNNAGAHTTGVCGEVCLFGTKVTTTTTTQAMTMPTTTMASMQTTPGVSGAWQLGAFTPLLIIAVCSI